MNTATQPNSVAHRYASALLAEALKAKALPAILSDIATLMEQLSDEDFTLLALPTLRPAQRSALVAELAKSLKLQTLTTNAILLLAQAKRLDILSQFLIQMVDLAAAHHGVLQARVEVAQPLTPAQLTKLEAQLSQQNPSAKGIEISQITKPSLLGGFRVFASGKVWDFSLLGRLQALQSHFNQSK